MTDIRRNLLWVVFSVSLLLIWDAWQKHNGHPSMFSPAPAKTVPVAKPPAAGVPAATTAPGTGGVPAPIAAATPGAAPAATHPLPTPSQKVEIVTDLVKATLDTQGGDLVRL